MWEDALVEVGCVTGGTVDPAAAAGEALAVIRGILPYAAGCISRYDPVTGRHHTLANADYPEPVLDHLDNWFVEHDRGYQTMRGADTSPLRWRDFTEFSYRDTYSAQEVFLPAGFVEGVTVCLYTRGGRYTGSMHLSVDDPGQPADDVMPTLRILQTMLSGVADGLRGIGDPLAVLGDTDHVALLGADGRVVGLPGRPRGPHLAAGGTLTAAVRSVPAGETSRFWWADDLGDWHRIRVYPVDGGVAIVESAEAVPHDLTARELDVLTLMAAGDTNPRIAAVLFVAPKTVAKHVEHVLAKLGCVSRTEAAVLAIREGLVRLPAPAR